MRTAERLRRISYPAAIRVNATPTGPATPTGGWSVVMAEGFNPVHALGHATSIFAPNRNNNAGDGGASNVAGFNSDEKEVFNSSQVSLKPDGVHLAAIYTPGVATGCNYTSGCISSQPVSPVGGEAGFPITGFTYEQLSGVTTALEAVVKLPSFYEGMDMGWWAIDGQGANEQDFIEWFGYTNVNDPPGQWGAAAAWIDHVNSTSNGAEVFNGSYQTDGAFHRYTTVVDGNALTVRTYVDGTLNTGWNYNWLTTWPTVGLRLLFSHAMRYVDVNQQPTWTTGTKEVVVRSVACYQDTPHVGSGITGGGIAAGTTAT